MWKLILERASDAIGGLALAAILVGVLFFAHGIEGIAP